MDAGGSSGITPEGQSKEGQSKEGQSKKAESRASFSPFLLDGYDANISVRPILFLETQPL